MTTTVPARLNNKDYKAVTENEEIKSLLVSNGISSCYFEPVTADELPGTGRRGLYSSNEYAKIIFVRRGNEASDGGDEFADDEELGVSDEPLVFYLFPDHLVPQANRKNEVAKRLAPARFLPKPNDTGFDLHDLEDEPSPVLEILACSKLTAVSGGQVEGKTMLRVPADLFVNSSDVIAEYKGVQEAIRKKFSPPLIILDSFSQEVKTRVSKRMAVVMLCQCIAGRLKRAADGVVKWDDYGPYTNPNPW